MDLLYIFSTDLSKKKKKKSRFSLWWKKMASICNSITSVLWLVKRPTFWVINKKEGNKQKFQGNKHFCVSWKPPFQPIRIHIFCEAENIQWCVKIFDIVGEHCSVLQQQIKPCLEKLKSDPDADVQFYAVEAYEGNLTEKSHNHNRLEISRFNFSFWNSQEILVVRCFFCCSTEVHIKTGATTEIVTRRPSKSQEVVIFICGSERLC